MRHLLRDLRYGLRLWLRRPGFAVVAVVTLALGIGANTAIFTVTHALLLKPLPYEHSDRIVILTENNLSRGWTSFSVSPANFLDWKQQTRSFELIAAYGGQAFNYLGGGSPERLRALTGTEGFLEIVGGTPVVGRPFRPDEFQPGRNMVAILGHGFWQRAFGGRTDVLEKPILLNGQSYLVVGVMHADWRFGGRDIAIFTPRAFDADESQARGAHYLSVVARLRPDVTMEQARTDMAALASRLEEQYPVTNKGWGTVVTSLLDAAVGNVRPMLKVLLGAVGLVLLVACANIANMNLARATVRGREMAIRTAIGAGRGRIVLQLLTESLLLGIAGGAIGLGLAWWGTTAIVGAYPTLLPRSSEIGVNLAVFGYTAGLSILTVILFGLAPAFAAARTDVNEMLKEGARGGSGPLRHWFRGALVVAEVALAVVLLVGAGILLRSFSQLTGVEPGFATENRLALTTILPAPKYGDDARRTAFYDEALERMRAIPGVESAALTSIVPISGNDEIYSIAFEGRPPLPPGQGVSAIYYLVSPDYFRTMGIPIKRGRGFTEQDRDGSTRVAIVDEVFVRLHFPNEDPIGQRIRMGRNSSIVREIVGVVAPVKHYALSDQEQAQMYEPFRQMPKGAMTFVLQSRADPGALVPAARQVIQSVDPEQPIATTSTLDQMLSNSLALSRVQAMLLGIFAAIALILAAVGLYGVMSYAVSQRTQEIGIRMALGAGRSSVLMMVLRQAARLTGIGLVLGVAGALALGRALAAVLEPLLFQVTPNDTVTLIIVCVVLTLAAVLATVVPARRATHVNPIRALRV
jgi:putative ABC transport system permease protein